MKNLLKVFLLFACFEMFYALEVESLDSKNMESTLNSTKSDFINKDSNPPESIITNITHQNPQPEFIKLKPQELHTLESMRPQGVIKNTEQIPLKLQIQPLEPWRPKNPQYERTKRYNHLRFFLGLGKSINAPTLETKATNQLTRNTSTVNETGNMFYTNTRIGTYKDGSVQDITSGYVGLEGDIDRAGVFTLRGYASASVSNRVDFGYLDSVMDGNIRKCGANQSPTLTSQCYRDEFYSSDANALTTPIKFNTLPSFSNKIANDAFMLSYGVGADVGVNIPISFVINRFSKLKIIPLKVGIYGGLGYEFITYSLGKFDNRSFNNTSADGVIFNLKDSLYLAGAGTFARYGVSVYISNNLRFDLGAKIPLNLSGEPSAKSQRWYLQESTVSGASSTSNPLTQQVLIQNYESKMQTQWYFVINVGV